MVHGSEHHTWMTALGDPTFHLGSNLGWQTQGLCCCCGWDGDPGWRPRMEPTGFWSNPQKHLWSCDQHGGGSWRMMLWRQGEKWFSIAPRYVPRGTWHQQYVKGCSKLCLGMADSIPRPGFLKMREDKRCIWAHPWGHSRWPPVGRLCNHGNDWIENKDIIKCWVLLSKRETEQWFCLI